MVLLEFSQLNCSRYLTMTLTMKVSSMNFQIQILAMIEWSPTWIDFLSAYVKLNSKKLSCPSYDVTEVEDRDELEELVSSLKDVLSVEADQEENKRSHFRIFSHMKISVRESEQR